MANFIILSPTALFLRTSISQAHPSALQTQFAFGASSISTTCILWNWTLSTVIQCRELRLDGCSSQPAPSARQFGQDPSYPVPHRPRSPDFDLSTRLARVFVICCFTRTARTTFGRSRRCAAPRGEKCVENPDWALVRCPRFTNYDPICKGSAAKSDVTATLRSSSVLRRIGWVPTWFHHTRVVGTVHKFICSTPQFGLLHCFYGELADDHGVVFLSLASQYHLRIVYHVLSVTDGTSSLSTSPHA